MQRLPKMLQEVSAAVLFIASILKRSQKVSNEVIAKFIVQLYQDLEARFQDHWFEELPERGSAFRCIRNTTRGGLDPRICKAGQACGISKCALTEILPSEFILWIDPQDVSYRVGEYGCLSKVTKEEMAKVHNSLKGSDATSGRSTSSPSKRTARSSPITIKSVDEVQQSSSTEDVHKLASSTNSQSSDSSLSSSEEHSKEKTTSSFSSKLSDNLLSFVAEDDVSITTSIFEQSMSLYDTRDVLLSGAANDFEQAYRLSEAAMNAAVSWNVNQLSFLAGNLWQQNQNSVAASGFNDYLATQAFTNTNSLANSAIYALN